jgi:tetratricopeptide (TPR) repeat protein
MNSATVERSGRGSSPKPGIQDILREALACVRANDTDGALAHLTAHPEATRRDAFACYLAGLILVNKRDDAAALPFYDRAIALNPRYTEALEGRARIFHRLGRFEHAVADYNALFRNRPAVAADLCNLGAAYEALQRRREALDCYNRALKASPNHAAALTAKALLLSEEGRTEEALPALRALTEAFPSDETAWYNLGAMLASSGNYLEACDCFANALQLVPAHKGALYGAAASLQKLGRSDDALIACGSLLSLEPSHAEALLLRGNLLFGAGLFFEALAAFDTALAQSPKHVGLLCNRGAALRELGRLEEAAAAFDAALAQKPACVEALLGRGIVDFKSGMSEGALACFEKAILGNPLSPTAFCGRGLALQHLGRIDAAKSDFEHALALQPDFPEGHSNLGALQLLLGDFERGWEGYEFRRIAGDRCKAETEPRFPVWNGEDIAGKKLLVLEEAAHGDAFMLARYFPVLAARGIEATVECLPHMLELLSQVPGVRLVTEVDPAERFDYQVHFFSLPRALKTRLETIPADVPYLKPDPARAEMWAERLGRHGFKIGVAWQGNPDPSIDMARSAPLANFAPLSAIGGVRLISLQKGFGTEQIGSAGFCVETLGDDFDAGPCAFVDSAAVIANLDLVVSIDTSIAHLAGALSRPVWVALKHIPEWRWMLARDDSPWYPTMRLFRQNAAGDWAGVFSRMGEALKALAAETGAVPAGASLLIPAAVGELIDKLTILEIKAERIPDPKKLANVKQELGLLKGFKESHEIAGPRLDALAGELKAVNAILWDIEEDIRQCERKGDFGPAFIELARRVYLTNDKRAALKRDINVLFGSAIVEEKYFTEN